MKINSIVIINNNSELRSLITLFDKLPNFRSPNLLIIDNYMYGKYYFYHNFIF